VMQIVGSALAADSDTRSLFAGQTENHAYRAAASQPG